MSIEFKEVFEALEKIPKKEDFKNAIKEAHIEYGTLTEDNANELFSFKNFIKCKFKKHRKDKLS